MQQLNWIKFDEKKIFFAIDPDVDHEKKVPENWSKKFSEKWKCVLIFLLNNKQDQLTLILDNNKANLASKGIRLLVL